MPRLFALCDIIVDQCDPADAVDSVYVGLEHIDAGSFLLTRHGRPAEVRSAKNRFAPGDLLYGKLRPYLDKAVLADNAGICSTDILVLRPKPGVSSTYVLAVLHSPAFRQHAMQATHGVNHPRTSWQAIAQFTCEELEPCKQQRIGDLLWTAQMTLARYIDTLGAARELKQTVMRQLFTRGLRAQGQKPTDYGLVPESWDIVSLGDCCEVQSGVTKGRKIPLNEALEVPYLRVANVQDGHLDLREIKTITIRADERQRYSLRAGDVVLTEGGDLDKLGRGFIWRGEIADCVHQNHVFAVRPDRARLTPEFLAYLVQSPYARAYFLSVAHKTTNLASINSTKLKAFPIPLPTLAEQDEIVDVLINVDRKLAVHEQKRACLQELFDVLLNDLMVRRVCVADHGGHDLPTQSELHHV